MSITARGAQSMLVALVLILGGAVACQKKTTGPTAADYQKKRAQLIAQRQSQANRPGASAAVVEPQGTDGIQGFAGSAEVAYRYDSVGKRDPFRSFVLDRLHEDEKAKGPLEQFELAQLELLGVVWRTDNARALVLDPSGQSYVVQAGDAIGKNEGQVISIDDNAMRVREVYVDYVGDKTTKEIEMRVRQSEGG